MPRREKRLSPEEREAVEREYCQVATLVKKGEWTSYGDIGQLVRGDKQRFGSVVGRFITSTSTFPNPHRVSMGWANLGEVVL